MKFPINAVMTNVHPDADDARRIRDLLEPAFPVHYELVCKSAGNNHQLTSTFDDHLLANLQRCADGNSNLAIRTDSRIAYDYSGLHQGKTLVIEVEKANREKILYDLLKFHVYLDSGADVCALLVPHQWVHTKGTLDLFSIAKERYDLCVTHKMIRPDMLSRIAIIGFNQYEGDTLIDHTFRNRARDKCRSDMKS